MTRRLRAALLSVLVSMAVLGPTLPGVAEKERAPATPVAASNVSRVLAQTQELTPTTARGKLGGWYARRRGVHLYHDGQEVIYAVRVRPRPRRASIELHLEVRHRGWNEIYSKRFKLRRGRARIAIVPLREGFLYRVSAEFHGNDTLAPSRSPWSEFRFTS